MTTITTFFVNGTPKPAGSKRGFAIKKGGQYTGRVVITDDCKTSRDWKTDVKFAAQRAYQGLPVTGALRLEITFYIQRPKSHYRSGAHSTSLKPSAPDWPTTKPDATKLLRGVEDALTGIVWKDDAQVVWQQVWKKYGTQPGCQLTVWEL